jgi:hypothetical protein
VPKVRRADEGEATNMTARDRDWVGITDAAAAAKVPAATIRDWYRSGVIGSMTTSQGARLVSLPEVMSYAGGKGQNHLRHVKGRLTRTPAQMPTNGETAATLNQTVADLQSSARDRLEPPEKSGGPTRRGSGTARDA